MSKGEYVSWVLRGRRMIYCTAMSAMLAVQGCAYTGKPEQASSGTGCTIGGAISAEQFRQALAAKGITEDDFFRELFDQGVPKAKQGLPKMVDAEMQIYDVTGSGREWGYWYRFPRQSSRIDPTALKNGIAPGIVNKICSTPATATFMALGGSYRYNYVAKDGKLITSISVSQQDCI